jgi:hypothetical protein
MLGAALTFPYQVYNFDFEFVLTTSVDYLIIKSLGVYEWVNMLEYAGSVI